MEEMVVPAVMEVQEAPVKREVMEEKEEVMEQVEMEEMEEKEAAMPPEEPVD